MAPAYFLEIDVIPGESRDPEHPVRLELTSFSWGETAGRVWGYVNPSGGSKRLGAESQP